MSDKNYKFETLALHAGYRSDAAVGSVAVPIHATTSFEFQDTDHAARLFALEEIGNIYTRITNPTNDALEKRAAAMEGGVAALALASGMTAVAYAIQNIARAGDNIVSSTDLYGGSHNLLRHTLKTQGIEVRFVDSADPENFRKATDEKTRAYFGETLANPKIRTFPIGEVAAIGREYGIPLLMDNTAAPYICRPFDHGAAVVIYSTSKWMNGHGNAIGGLIIDGGNFDWEKVPERIPALTQPDSSYHNAVWVDAVRALGPVAYIIKARTTILRDLGGCLSPFNAFLNIQGMETLALRMRAHCENAQKVADFLAAHPKVDHVVHPSLMAGDDKARADKYLTGGYGGLVGCELKGGVEAGKRFIDSLELIYHLANIGDARSLAIHPASTTHSRLNDEERLAAGVPPGYVRLSIGIEHIDDILADLAQALDKA